MFLPGQGLWLDPRRGKEFAFISHAHSDHIARHRRVILSEATSRLLAIRLTGQRKEEVLGFGEGHDFGSFRATLLPAGHVLGSAQLFVEAAEGSLLYTGDFKLRPGASCGRAEWCAADTLIMETTFGLPRYVFPPAEEIEAEFVRICRGALDEGLVPLVLAYSLGKAQEAMCLAARAALPVMVHPSVQAMAEVYAELDPRFPSFSRYSRAGAPGHVVVCPPGKGASVVQRGLGKVRTIALSGWAMDTSFRFRTRCDAALPLSDHAGYDDLLRLVEWVAPRRVFTVHGFAVEFAADLRRRGVEAWALDGANQLEFSLPFGGSGGGGTT